MIKILVADPLAQPGLDRIEQMDGVEYDVKTGLGEDELAKEAGGYDGMIVRSGVQVTAKVLENRGKLRAIARAGVGVDNIDLDAATQAGILVMNTPDANTISTAEQTMALILAMSRHTPKADAHVRAREWKRKAFVGTQLAGKTLGVIGLGRVGRAVAARAAAFEMKIVAYDPFFSGSTALEGKVTLLGSPQEVFAKADYLTLHTKLSDETRGMINKNNIAKMKDGIRIVNSSRGGVINEADLAEALKEGKVAAAALDVYSSEPPDPNNPMLEAPNTVLAPHLGASTKEAQLAVTLDAVDALISYLTAGEIRYAVNVAGLPSQMSDRDKAYLDLALRMGTILGRLCSGVIKSVSTKAHGESLAQLSKTLSKQFMIGLLDPHCSERLNLINIDQFVRERGIQSETSTDSAVSSITDSMSMSITTSEGTRQIQGEISVDGRPRIMAIDGYEMSLVPEGEMVMIQNDDQPGVIGMVGTLFGSHEVNIADFMLSRQNEKAFMTFKLDAPMPEDTLKELQSKKPPINTVLPVTLPPIK